MSLKVRKLVEEVLGCLGKLHHRGIERVNALFIFATAAYNLIRIKHLTAPGVTYWL